MNFKPKLLIGGMVLILLTLIVAGIAYYLTPRSSPKGPVETGDRQEGLEDFLQKRGEAGLRKRQALSLIPIYEKMLLEFPDNVDLKKKLAAAYRDAGQEEEAKRLEEKIRGQFIDSW